MRVHKATSLAATNWMSLANVCDRYNVITNKEINKLVQNILCKKIKCEKLRIRKNIRRFGNKYHVLKYLKYSYVISPFQARKNLHKGHSYSYCLFSAIE